MNFEWDENKNQINKKKHGISFEVARSVFDDDGAILFDDPEHSTDEERFLIIGYAANVRICIVSHCYRDNDVIRIISAREATTREKQVYRKWNGRL
ncbi:MAG: BrnT family toxin [Clostridiales bacterium]|nr:BrnT family toxin [Clostridiales bacterium]MCD8154352.1 BrnT family toxin [Clostridiales bacterium]